MSVARVTPFRSAGRTICLAATLLAGFAATASTKEAPAPETLASSSKFCGAGFDTPFNAVTPPTGSAIDNPSVASVKMKKSCKGAVEVRTESTLESPNSNAWLSAIAAAVCLRPGGYANACKKGSRFFADPGLVVLLANDTPISGTYGAIWVFRDLAPGIWRFELRASSDNGVKMHARMMAVEAFVGG